MTRLQMIKDGEVNFHIWNYSQTCEERPPNGKTEHGLYKKLVFIWRYILFYFFKEGLFKYGLYLQCVWSLFGGGL